MSCLTRMAVKYLGEVGLSKGLERCARVAGVLPVRSAEDRLKTRSAQAAVSRPKNAPVSRRSNLSIIRSDFFLRLSSFRRVRSVQQSVCVNRTHSVRTWRLTTPSEIQQALESEALDSGHVCLTCTADRFRTGQMSCRL